MNDKYSQKCADVTFGNKTYAEQQIYKKIDGYSVSEMTLLKENKKSKGLFATKQTWDFMRLLNNFDETKVGSFKYDMYQKQFHMLLDTCSYEKIKTIPKTNTTVESTLKKTVQIKNSEVPDILKEANHMVYWVFVLKWSVYGMIWIQAIEFFMIFMHNNDALAEGPYNKIVIARQVIGLAAVGFCFFCTWGIYQWDGLALVAALSENKCTTDPVM
jgi:hypothetical protein